MLKALTHMVKHDWGDWGIGLFGGQRAASLFPGVSYGEMEPTPYAECSSEAPGLEATGKKGSPFQPVLDVGDVSRESMLAVLGKWSFALKAF